MSDRVPMHPPTFWSLLLAAAASALLLAGCGRATAVEDIPTGSQVVVKLDDGQIVRGRLMEVESSSLVVKSAIDGRDTTIKREAVVGVEPQEADEASARDEAPAEPEYDEITLAAGTKLSVDLETALVSNGSHVEDTVRATTRSAVVVDGVEAIPAGSRLMGEVTEATPSGKVQGRARLAFSFNQLMSAGDTYEISTRRFVYTAAGTKKEDATKIGIGAAAGTLIGGIAGGKKGAAVGAAVGGGAGTAVVLSTTGDEVRLSSGTDLSVELLNPVTVRVKRSAS